LRQGKGGQKKKAGGLTWWIRRSGVKELRRTKSGKGGMQGEDGSDVFAKRRGGGRKARFRKWKSDQTWAGMYLCTWDEGHGGSGWGVPRCIARRTWRRPVMPKERSIENYYQHSKGLRDFTILRGGLVWMLRIPLRRFPARNGM